MAGAAQRDAVDLAAVALRQRADLLRGCGQFGPGLRRLVGVEPDLLHQRPVIGQHDRPRQPRQRVGFAVDRKQPVKWREPAGQRAAEGGEQGRARRDDQAAFESATLNLTRSAAALSSCPRRISRRRWQGCAPRRSTEATSTEAFRAIPMADRPSRSRTTLRGPVGYLVDAALGDHTLTAAAARAEVRHMSTEIAGGGQVTPTAVRIMESGIRRVLAKVGALSGEPPPAAAKTRIMQVRGQDYYVYALDPGLFEPLVELGDSVEPGTPAALIHPHDTPWREPAIAAFGRAGTVICKRVPGRVERGDCLFHLTDDFVP